MSAGIPRVSIVTPTYNHAHFLPESIGSVVAQSYHHWELMVVNDHSTDNTVEVVNAFGDPRIRLLTSRRQGNIAASRNLGVQQSRGGYVAFLDSDDKWLPDKLARCIAVLEAGADLVCHGEDFVWDDGRRKPVIYGPQSEATYRNLLYRKNCLSTSAVVIRRDLLVAAGGFSEDERLVTAEDYDLWLKVANTGSRIDFIPRILGEYRLHSGNSTKSVYRHRDAVLRVLQNHFAGPGRPDTLSDRMRASWRMAKEFYVVARVLVQDGRWSDALRECARSIAVFPLGRALRS